MEDRELETQSDETPEEDVEGHMLRENVRESNRENVRESNRENVRESNRE